MSMTIFGGNKDGIEFSTMVSNNEKFFYNEQHDVYGTIGYFRDENAFQTKSDKNNSYDYWDGFAVIVFDRNYNFIDANVLDVPNYEMAEKEARKQFDIITSRMSGKIQKQNNYEKG